MRAAARDPPAPFPPSIPKPQMPAKSVPPRPVPRLYLATPAIDDPAPLEAMLAAALAAADVAAVLLRLSPSDPRTLVTRVKALAPVVQGAGAALLLDGHDDLVARGGADGAHLAGIRAMQAALPHLKPERIVGVGGLASRHDAMIAGEDAQVPDDEEVGIEAHRVDDAQLVVQPLADFGAVAIVPVPSLRTSLAQRAQI